MTTPSGPDAMASAAEFKVEKGVPMPAAKGRGTESKFPWADMEVGDSFFVKVPAGESYERNINSLITGGRGWGNRHNREKFSSRRVDGGIRVWRIE